jgi:hypothetical protein
MKITLTAIATTVALMGMAEASHHTRHLVSSHQFNIEDAMNNKEIVLMSLGAAVYYSQYCAGLTSRGQMYLNKAAKLHKINFKTVEDDKDFKVGYKTAESYPTCGKLRFAITDAGLGAMIR